MLWRTLGEHPWLCRLRTKPRRAPRCRREVFRAVSVGQTFLAQPEDTVAIPLAQEALTFFAREDDQLQTLFLSRVVQPCTVLMGHDRLPSEPVGWMLNTSRWGVQVLLWHVKKSDGNRSTLEISNGDKCFGQWYVHDLDKWQRMPTEYSFKRVHGAGDLIPRRFVIEVDITAATSLLKHAASFGFQHFVKGDIINILMLLDISPEVRMPSAWWSCANC